MRSLSLLILTLLLSVSCKSLTGNVEVFETLTLTKKGKEVQIVPGNYKSTMKVKSKTKMKLKIDGKSFNFYIPKGTSIPRENGKLYLTSDQIRQPYNLSTIVKTDYWRSDSTEGYETCTYAIPYTVCNRTGHYGGTICNTYYRTYPGQRYSKWHTLTTKKNVSLYLLSTQNDEAVAEFISNKTKVKRVYEYEGLCR